MTHPGVAAELKPHGEIPAHLKKDDFIECRGRFATASAHYTPQMAKLVWKAFEPKVPRAVPCMIVERVQERILPPGPPTMPLWCCMITRTVAMKSEEAKSEKAKEAISTELQGHNDRGTWDLS